MTTTRPARVWAEVTGGDALGRGQQPALCWWLPEGSSVQHAYRLRTDDGYDTGRVDGAIQSFVRLPVFDRSRRSVLAQVRVWTDAGRERVERPRPARIRPARRAGLAGPVDRRRGGRTAGDRGRGPPTGSGRSSTFPRRPRPGCTSPRSACTRRSWTGRASATPNSRPATPSTARGCSTRPTTSRSLARPGRHVLAVLLADGWYRGQVGLPRSADQYGGDVALRAQLEVRTGTGWQVAAASQPGWRTAPFARHRGRPDRRPARGPPTAARRACTTCPFDDRDVARRPLPATSTSPSSGRSLPRCAGSQEIRPAAVRPVRGGDAYVVDFGQNFNGWVRLQRPRPAAPG